MRVGFNGHFVIPEQFKNKADTAQKVLAENSALLNGGFCTQWQGQPTIITVPDRVDASFAHLLKYYCGDLTHVYYLNQAEALLNRRP